MASSSNSEVKCCYDIFLSFRGSDTRKKFTGYLNEALKQEGFKTFIDDDEIERGEKIKSALQKAICSSRMSIIVLSKNYANSTACLFEIQAIIENHKKRSDHFILPVFYEVDPAEIKEQAKNLDFGGKKVMVEEAKGWRAALNRYILPVLFMMDPWEIDEPAEYFDFGGKKVIVEEVEGWSAALQEVASMAGMVSGNQSDGYEAKFIKDIIGLLKSKQAGDYLDLDEKLLNLKRKVEYLSSQESDINSKISSVERLPWGRPRKEVEVWLTHVQRCKDEVQRLEQKIDGETNVFLRICLEKDIARKIVEVLELQEKCKGFVSLLIDDNPIDRLTHPLPKDFVISTMARNRERIWEFLMNDDVRAIGVYGMGGIGKTTIMKYIHNQLLEKTDKLVYWVTVSKTLDIAKLQSDIAKALDFSLREYEELTERAMRLHAALSKQRSYVLILDDVWESFHLDEVGIPEPTRSNGCKLVLTTRSLEACQKMGWEPVKVHLFTEEEAWNLFLTKAVEHDTVLSPDVEKIACQISKECARLPLAIVTVAGSLRGLREMRDWRNALKELNSLTRDACDVIKVLERLQFSYNRLGDKVLRDCFLYCSLYPEDDEIEVDNLIEYWIAEGLISENDSVEAQFDEGHSILKKLERSCLLERHSNLRGIEYVTMHDLIRDMALKITQSSPRFLVKAGKELERIPSEDSSMDVDLSEVLMDVALSNQVLMDVDLSEVDVDLSEVLDRVSFIQSSLRSLVKAGEELERIPFEDWSEDLDRVSFMRSCIRELPNRPPVCPRLATLLLSHTIFSEIFDCFFINMPGLKVLNLSHNHRIKSLPESISNLENLQAIILEDCAQLVYVPSLKRLKALKRFSLSGSNIEELPEGIEELVNLRRLDLEYNYRLGEIPSWKLSRLSKLQYLIILTWMGVSAEHLLCLRQLRVVVAKFQNVQHFNEYVKSQEFQGLENYRFSVGGYCGKPIRCGKGVNIVSNSESLGSGLDDLVLPADLDYLHLVGCDYPKSLAAIPCMKDARDLRQCHLDACMGLESVFSSSIFSKDGQIILRTVETLHLYDIPRFRVLFDEIPPPRNIFFNLERLSIANCHAVKKIFPFQLLHNFPNLDFLRVSWCLHLEDIIVEKEEISDCDHHRDNRNVIITVPKLKTLQLIDLPRLRSIYDGVMVCPCLEEVTVLECPRLSRLPFSLHMDSKQVTAPALRHIYAKKQWWESLEWDDPLTKTTLQPYFL